MPNNDNRLVVSVNQNDQDFPIGADAKNIFITWQENGETKTSSVQDFFDNWQQFKNEAVFMQYSENAPASNQVKLWFKTNNSE